ncbi:MAG TPA: protoporphyrinogen oxidase [Blastocatellia bacterium]|nr:protoporphyrinogen oxidase [Blastocatellia bacterium]
MQNHRAVVVIGAGISGLVCAYRLKTLGVDVALIEKSDRVGGVIQSERIGGFLIERGPNSSQGTEELVALVDELGIIDELVEGDPKAPAYVYFSGRLHAVPSGPGAFIKSKLLSVAGKLRIFREPFVSVRRENSEESVASFARRRIGREAAERMVAPFVSGIYAGDAEQLSVQAAFPKLANLETGYGGLFRGTFAKAREARRAKKAASDVLDKAAPTRRRLCSFRSGMGFLPSTLASRIGEDLITGCRELRIADSGSRSDTQSPRFIIEFERGGDQHHLLCDKIVISAPAGAAAELVRGISDRLSGLLEEITYPRLAILSLAYDVSSIATPLDGFGFLVPPGEQMNILGCVWNSSLFKYRSPEGKALVTVFIGGARNPDIVRRADDDLVSIAHRELQKVLGISEEPTLVAITRYERAIPQYNLGHYARVQEIESLLHGLPELRLVGNYLHGVATGDCIKEADRVARELAAALEAPVPQ